MIGWLVYIRGALSRKWGEHVSWAPGMDDIRFRFDIPTSSNIRTWRKLKQSVGDLHNPLFVKKSQDVGVPIFHPEKAGEETWILPKWPRMMMNGPKRVVESPSNRRCKNLHGTQQTCGGFPWFLRKKFNRNQQVEAMQEGMQFTHIINIHDLKDPIVGVSFEPVTRVEG